MRVLLVGAGGVGTAVTRIAARRDVLRAHGRRRLRPRPRRGGGRRARRRRDRFRGRAGRRAPTRRRSPRCWPRHRCDVLLNATDPRFVMPLFRAALAAGAHYLDMAMSLSAAAPGATRTSSAGVKLGDEQFAQAAEWETAGRLALVGMGVEPGLSDVFARYAADELFDEIEEIGVRDGANLTVDGYDFAPSFSHLDHHRGVPEPAGGLGGGPRLVHHRAVQRAGGLRLPRGHRPGRVRQRRARGGAADAALGRRAPGDLQVRPGRGVHRRAEDAAQARPGPHRAGPRRRRPVEVVAARRGRRVPAGPGRRWASGCTARPARAPGCSGTARTGAPREVYLYHVVDNAVVDARVRLARRWCGRPPSTRSSPWNCWPPARGRARACSARRRSTPRPFLDLLTAYGSPWGMREGG